MSELRRHLPPRRYSQLPAAGGRIGPEPEDFQVDEVPAYLPSGSGEHLFVRMQKRTLTTRDLLRIVAKASGVRERDIGVAGMKDKHAVTTQWLSLPARTAADPSIWQLPEGVELLEASRHGNKLRTGHQRGNRFSIRLIEVAPDRAARLAREISEHGLPNYFGAQRFGREGDNLEQALEWLAALEGPPARGGSSRFHNKFWPSVIQSEVFNRYLTARLAQGIDHLLSGEIVRLANTQSLFSVEEPERELPRWQARDILPTGPMPGPKMKAAAAQAAELEQRILTELGIASAALAALGKRAPGTRRDLLVWPESLELDVEASDVVRISFGLPSGSYATVLLDEITGPAQ